MSGIAGLVIRNLLIAGRTHAERLPEQISHVAWHRISFAEDGPTRVRETGETLWPDVLPVADDELDGLQLRARFADTRRTIVQRADGTRHYLKRPGASTGGRDPYSLLVLADGSVDQLCEIGEVTPHAAQANIYALGIAMVGDMRARPPTPAQWQTCVTLAALWYAWGLESQGHTMLDGASSDPGKVCPGSHFGLPQLRTASRSSEIAALTRYEAEAILVEAGIVL